MAASPKSSSMRKELIIFGDPIRCAPARWSLIGPALVAHLQVGNRGVFRTRRYDGRPRPSAVALYQIDRFDGLRQRAVWLTLHSKLLPPAVRAVWMRLTLVTSKSSPTICGRSPAAQPSAPRLSQSSSCRPSSMEIMGYLSAHDLKSTISGPDNVCLRLSGGILPSSAKFGRGRIHRQHNILARLCSRLPLIASRMRSTASLLAETRGAKPPSSPTVVP